VNCICLTKAMFQWRSLVNTVINVRVVLKARESLDQLNHYYILETLLYGVNSRNSLSHACILPPFYIRNI